MISSSCARLALNFSTVLRRFWSRSLSASLAMRSLSVLEGEAERRQQRTRLVVGSRRGGDGDVHSPQGVDLVVLDLGENDLLLEAEAVVAAAVERAVRHAAEVADPRDRDVHQAIEELVHARAAQRHHAADREARAHLEVRDRLARLGHDRLLSGDAGHVGDGVVENLLVGGRLADAHVERDLRHARHLHHGLVAEFLHQIGNDLRAVVLAQPRRRRGNRRRLVLRGLGCRSAFRLLLLLWLLLLGLAALLAFLLRPLLLRRVFLFLRHRVLLYVYLFAVRAEHANLAAVGHHLEPDAVGLLRRRVEQCNVGDVDRHVLVDDAALLALHRVRALVLLHAVDAFDDDVLGVDAPQHGAALALVAARDHDDLVAFADSLHGGSSQSTSGASETIFMKRSVRSSRVTGPKMRVPIGSSLAFSSTAALPSNLTSEPSWRRTPLAVRTTTALYTSPFFTRPR